MPGGMPTGDLGVAHRSHELGIQPSAPFLNESGEALASTSPVNRYILYAQVD
jgi:hypothetical protein